MDYGKTLNLPKTDFPMRAKLPKREPEFLNFWEEIDIYEKVREKRKGAPMFVLHDGPPYANGAIHTGHVLNKVLKDIVVKYHTMKGYDSPFVPGWDTHGLPIEHQIIKTRNVRREDVSDLEFRRMCRDYALEYVDVQREQFKRLGVRGDWENPYLTLSPSFEAKQIEVFGIMARRGYIYKGLKPVYWCPVCETALAEAEVEYGDRRSDSIYVKFPVTEDKGKLGGTQNTYCLIWTTTPWTIPANLATAVHPGFDYVLVEAGEERYLLAEGLLEEIKEKSGKEMRVVQKFKGTELEGIRCTHPLYDRESPLVLSEHVTLEQGTGCVHIAPGHGQEDFDLGKEYNLEVLNPVDSQGRFTDEAGRFAGLRYDKGNGAVIEALDEGNYLLVRESVEHQYPHCWRCKDPILFRATEQWFASIEGFRKEALDAIRKVKWMPRWGEERIYNMVAERQDWCISRQRAWGVPIPVFYCRHCEAHLLNDDTIRVVQELFREEGSDAWFAREASEILPAGTSCPSCGGKDFRKETDIMDVWFDSGSSHIAVCEEREDQHWPADLYLEGSDQYRGWFQSSLLTSVATRGEPPYRAVLCNGWTVDGEGKKMSKSLGNVISPEEVINQHGADILRLWVSSADFTRDVHISNDILNQLTEIYRKIRNTSRFMMGNLKDFDPAMHRVSDGELEKIDRWAMGRLQQLIRRVTRAYDNYEYHLVFHSLHNFCVVDMSNFYLDIIKDRLYCSQQDSVTRRTAQTVLYELLRKLVIMFAPVLAYTSEEIWQKLPGSKEQSVQLEDWPEPEPAYEDEEYMESWETFLKARSEISRALEEARSSKSIGASLEAGVVLYAEEPLYSTLEGFAEGLADLLIVSQAELRQGKAAEENVFQSDELPLQVKVNKAEGEKCERCWVYTPELGENQLCPRCSSVMETINLEG